MEDLLCQAINQPLRATALTRRFGTATIRDAPLTGPPLTGATLYPTRNGMQRPSRLRWPRLARGVRRGCAKQSKGAWSSKGRYAITGTIDRREALRRLAADYKASPSETLEDLLTFALDEDAAIARRTLRVVRRSL
jgi:hypothetical protein